MHGQLWGAHILTRATHTPHDQSDCCMHSTVARCGAAPNTKTPDGKLATRSGFYVNASAMPRWAARMSAAQRTELRRGVHLKLKGLMEQVEDAAKAAHAGALFDHHRDYFCADGVC